MATPLIFAIGHYLGSNYPGEGAELDSHVLRIGWRLHRLERTDEFAVWALAHGLPEGPRMAPWTLAATEGAARASGVSDAAPVLTELLGQDLIVEIDPESEEAEEFARFCRFRALHGVSGDPTGSAEFPHGLGWIGGSVSLQADPFTFEVWKWAPACDNLWHACEILAKAQAAAAGGSGDPRELLPEVLHCVQLLVAHGVGYLDEAREEWELESALADQGTQP